MYTDDMGCISVPSNLFCSSKCLVAQHVPCRQSVSPQRHEQYDRKAGVREGDISIKHDVKNQSTSLNFFISFAYPVEPVYIYYRVD